MLDIFEYLFIYLPNNSLSHYIDYIFADVKRLIKCRQNIAKPIASSAVSAGARYQKLNIAAESTSKKACKSTASSTASARARYQKLPRNSIRYDGNNHLPRLDSKKSATRCKNKDCDGRSHFFCVKCDVHLCIQKNRRCFEDFHTLSNT